MQAILFIGIQATGKSTFYKEHFFHTHVRISLDLLRTRHREAAFLDVCQQTRQPFVVDNTNPTVADRQRYIESSKRAGYEIIGYYFESKVGDALARNDQRTETQRIPVQGVLHTAKRLALPSYVEGFSRLYYVRLADNGTFCVEEWQDEV